MKTVAIVVLLALSLCPGAVDARLRRHLKGSKGGGTFTFPQNTPRPIPPNAQQITTTTGSGQEITITIIPPPGQSPPTVPTATPPGETTP